MSFSITIVNIKKKSCQADLEQESLDDIKKLISWHFKSLPIFATTFKPLVFTICQQGGFQSFQNKKGVWSRFLVYISKSTSQNKYIVSFSRYAVAE